MGPKKLRKFLIVFDNSSLLYFPGHLISGRVIAELDEMTPVTGVYLHVMGESVVRVTDRQQQTLHDEENYLNFRLRLHGEPDANYPLESESGTTAGKDQFAQTLDRGIHSFPFKLGLPLGLPSTFLGKHGYVQYFCRAALREANGLTHKNQQAFIVMNPIDLNLEPSILAQPFLCEVEQRLGLSCLAGPINCKVRLDRGGYVPGENIIVWARVRNGSRVPIRRTRACLTETVQYMTRNKVVETEMRELASAARGRIPSGASDEWNDEQLTVPPLPPTNLTGSRLIRIQYDMLFIIEPAGLERSIKLQLPIRLATYPFRDADGTLKRPAHYPESLPILRPWVPGKDGP